jgi:hypothetical protein
MSVTFSCSHNPLTAYPRIRAGSFFARKRGTAAPFPFDGSGIQIGYHYARNAIYALSHAWSLAGQEILVPAYVEGVEVEALVRAGARPRFYPVDGNMRFRTESVLDAVLPTTRAVYVIHYLGFAQEIASLAQACRERNLLLLEDCAQALFSRCGTQPLGTFGDAAVFSFRKSLPVPDGALLIFNRPPERIPATPQSPPKWPILVDVVGSVLLRAPGARWWVHPVWAAAKAAARRRPTAADGGRQGPDPAANIAVSSTTEYLLSRLDFEEVVLRRRCNYECLETRLRELLPPIFRLREGICPLLYAARVRRREEALSLLGPLGIEEADYWPSNHPLLQGHYPECECLHASVIGLPCHQDIPPELMPELAERIARVVAKTPSAFTGK